MYKVGFNSPELSQSGNGKPFRPKYDKFSLNWITADDVCGYSVPSTKSQHLASAAVLPHQSPLS